MQLSINRKNHAPTFRSQLYSAKGTTLKSCFCPKEKSDFSKILSRPERNKLVKEVLKFRRYLNNDGGSYVVSIQQYLSKLNIAISKKGKYLSAIGVQQEPKPLDNLAKRLIASYKDKKPE